MTPQLSIIVPVYNAAPFLEDCLKSLLKQSLSNIEVICINDGSTDNSLEILNHYASKYNRIKIYSQSNAGVAAARNFGIQFATGEYIGFVDADDVVAENYFELFIEENGTDLIALKPANWTINPPFLINRSEIATVVFKHMLEFDNFNSVCFKIFRKSLILNYSVNFPVGVRLGEDAHFVFQFLKYAQTVCIIQDAGGYFYRENMASATRKDVLDYSVFDRVFSEFHFDHKLKYDINLSDDQILNAKLHKLFATYLSALSLYFRANTKLSKHARWQMVKKSMQQFLLIYQINPNHPFWKINRGRFENLILAALVNNQFWKLKLAFAYSHWRNGIK